MADERMISIAVIAVLTLGGGASASDECWSIGRFDGSNAVSPDYAHFPDAIAEGQIICLTEESGFVSGDDIPLIRFGSSTLIGWSENGLGLESVTTYQIDRENNRLFFTQSRIGTASVAPALPDKVMSATAPIRPIGN